MNPIFQTKFPPKHPVGNCLAAVVASVLDLPIEEVPNFEVLGEGPIWKNVLVDFFGQRNFFVEPDYALIGYYGRTQQSSEEPRLRTFPLGYENVPYVCYGEVLGVPHVVIMANDKLVHDPMPKGAGLDVVSEVWVFRHKLDGLGGLHRGLLLKLDHVEYSTVIQVPEYDEQQQPDVHHYPKGDIYDGRTFRSDG